MAAASQSPRPPGVPLPGGGGSTSAQAHSTGAAAAPELTSHLPQGHDVDRCAVPAGAVPRVVGLDLSADSTGVALADGSTYVIKAPKAAGKKRTLADDLRRLDKIAASIGPALRHDPPPLAVIEDYAPGIRSAAAHRLAEIGGVVRLVCFRADAPIALVNPMHLKIYATGSSRADKRDMALAAYKRVGREFATDDECDAFWLRAMGLDHLGHPLVAMPKTHREALAKVAWPPIPELNPETP